MPLLEQGITSGGNFITAILLAKVLGAGGYGDYTMMWMVALYFIGIHHVLVTQPMQVFMGKPLPKNLSKQYLAGVFWLQMAMSALFAGLLSGICYFLGAWIYQSVPYTLCLQLGGYAFFFLNYDFIRKLAYIEGKLTRVAITSTVAYALQISCLLWAASQGKGLGFFLGCFMLGQSLGVLGNLSLIANFQASWPVCKAIAAKHFMFGKWLLGTSAIQWLTGNLFFFATGAVLGNAAVGVAKVAQNIVGALHVIFMAFENYVPSRAAKQWHKNGITGMVAYLKDTSVKAGIIIITMALVIVGFAEEMLVLIYGPTYKQYALVLRLFAVHYLIVYTLIPCRIAIRAIERNHLIFKANLMAAFISLAIAWPMVYLFGILGAVLGMMASQACILLFYWVSLRKIAQHENYSLTTG